MEYRMNRAHNKILNDTYKCAIDIIQKNKKCMILRPITFNIPMLISKILVNLNNNKILFIYQSKRLIYDTIGMLKAYNMNIVCVKYNALDKVSIHDYDVIVMYDISHTGDSRIYNKIIKNKQDLLSKILIGVDYKYNTSTYDIIGSIFDGNIVPEYSLDDAIRDGIMNKPYYVYTYDRRNMEVENGLDYIIEANDNILNAEDVIRRAIDDVYKGKTPEYMKYVVFMSRKDIIRKRSSEIKQWFINTFPDHKVNEPIHIFSDEIEKHNIAKLKSLVKREREIDIVISIDMLNNSIDIDDITAVLFLRSTKSHAIYQSQFNCALQNINSYPIIIDFVSNIRTPYIFTNIQEDEKAIRRKYNMDRVSSENIYVIDKVAKIRDVLIKFGSLPSTNIEKRIISDRLGPIPYPASYLSKLYKLSITDTLGILDKYEIILKAKGRQKQARDMWIDGKIGGTRV